MPRVAHRYETAWGGFKQTFLEMVWLQFDQRWQNPIFFLKRLVTYVTNSTHYCQAVGTEPVLTLLFISQLQTVSLAFHVVIVDLPRIHTGFSPTPHIFSPPQTDFCVALLYIDCAGFCSGTNMYIIILCSDFLIAFMKRTNLKNLICTKNEILFILIYYRSKCAAFQIFVITWFNPAGLLDEDTIMFLFIW